MYGFASFFLAERKGFMHKNTKHGERISPNMLLAGIGFNYLLAETKHVRIYRQSFSADACVDTHSHENEWEIVLGGPKRFSIYRPGKLHGLKWDKRKYQFKSWSIISIKIGKKP